MITEALKMPTAISPSPPPPFQGAIEASSRILVTREVEQTFERIRFDSNEHTPQLLDTVLDTDTPTLEYPAVQYWIYRTKKRLAHKAARAWTQWIPLCMLKCSKSSLAGVSHIVLSARRDLINRIQFLLSPALWYNFWTVVSSVVLYASILRYLESSLACESLLFSTCGEMFALIKHVHVHYSAPQLDQRFLLVFASLSFLKFILVCVLFFVDWSEFIDTGGLLAFSALIICGLQSALSQIYRIVARSSEHDSSATWREVRDLKKAFDVDVESAVLDSKMGRQYLRDGSLTALNSEVDCMLYTLIRLSNLGNHKTEEIFVKLDKVGRLHEVASALELPDESWEMVVLKTYLPELETRLNEIFPGCHFDPMYDPTEPSREEVERLFVAARNSKLPGKMVEDVKRSYIVAKILRIDASSSRAMAMIREGCWPVAAAYYSCLLERNITWLKENAS